MKRFLATNKKWIITITAAYLVAVFILFYYDRSLTNKLVDKVWIHRVNSKEKLEEVGEHNFKGLEFDVVYMKEKNNFDVNHPPAKSIDLSLFDYLSSTDIGENVRFWVDFKNLSSENFKGSVTRLSTICHTLRLKKNRFIVESEHPQFLGLFQESGFKTSYYLPTSLCSTAPELLENELKTVEDNIRLYPSDYISLDKCNYKLIAESFPKKRKLLWSFPYKSTFTLDPRSLIRLPEQIAIKRKLLSDQNVEVVLFGYDALKGNR